MKFPRTTPLVCVLTAICLAALVPAIDFAKAPPPGASNVDAAKAEVNATLMLAGIKVSRLALGDDPALADSRDAIGAIYDRQEAATNDGVTQLKAAAGDKAKTAAAVAAIQAAGNEANQYFAAHKDTKAKIDKRVTIINNELKQIRQTPDAYVAAVAKAGLAGDPLARARSLVKAASQKAASASDSEGTDAVLSARTDVRKMLSARQSLALDGLMGGK